MYGILIITNKNFQKNLIQVDSDLNDIKNNGRQFFIEKQPINFSKTLHDYSADRKGFVVWKNLLEERLF